MPTQVARRKCLNPICPNGGFFIPPRIDAFHCPGCRIKKHNHLRRVEKLQIFHREKTLKHNARRLAYIHSLYAPDEIPILILKHEKIDMTVFTDVAKNADTGGTIFWSHNFGVEIVAETPTKSFKIHKR